MEATIAKFTYTKDDGSVSHRNVLLLSSPNDTYFGLEIEGGDLTSVAGALDYLVEREKMIETLRLKYGMDDKALRYRRFKQAKVTNLTEEKITI